MDYETINEQAILNGQAPCLSCGWNNCTCWT